MVACKMIQQIYGPVSLTLNRVVEGKNYLSKVALWPLHINYDMHAHTDILIHVPPFLPPPK